MAMDFVNYSDMNDSDDEVWEDTRIRYCIQETRCRLCSFGLKEGDRIRIGPKWTIVSGYKEFIFHRGDVKSNSQAIICCCGSSDHYFNDATSIHCFHAECFIFVRDTYKIEDISPDFLQGTRFSFVPPLWGEFERQRANRLSHLLTEKLKKGKWPRSLPDEIWRMVTDDLVRECAIVTAYEQTLSVDKTFPKTIDLSRDVYAEYTMFDGIRYLKALCNLENLKGHGQLALRGQEVGSIREVYVIDDHFGVRDLLFVSDKERQRPSPSSLLPGTWVRRISASLGVWEVGINFDGFRVRGACDMQLDTGSGFDPSQNVRFREWLSSEVTIFDVRSSKPRYQRFYTRSNTDARPFFPQMGSFDCNVPGITGYSAAVTYDGVVAIYSHYGDSDYSMYNEVNPLFPVQWMYMPIDQGEFVTEICRFTSRNTKIRPRPYGLLFTTNRGRTGVFGGYFHLTQDPKCQRVYDPPSRPSTIFFDKERAITWLAFENAKPLAKWEIPQSAIPITTIDLSPAEWYYSRCEMKGVTRIIPSLRSDCHHKPLVGLLLEYEDGHRERMGEWRFDWAAEPIRVLDHSGSLRLKEMPDHRCNEQECKVWHMELVPASAPPCEEEDYEWYIDMPWDGVWEWWFDFSPLQCTHSHAEWLSTPDIEAETLDDEDVPWQEWVDWDEVWPAWFNDKSMPPWYEPSEDELDEESDIESD